MKHVATITALCVVLAGCAGSEASGTRPETPLVDENSGAIRGTVTDDSVVPIPGATVMLLPDGPTVTTDESGVFALATISPGNFEVVAVAPGYSNLSQRVDVVAGEVATINFVLRPLASDVAYHLTAIKHGKIFCGAAWRHPRVLVPGVTNTTGTAFAVCGVFFGTPLNNTDSFVVPFETSRDIADVEGLVFETTWQASQVFGKGLNLGWEAAQDIVAYSFTEKLRTFVRVQGVNPLHATVNETVIKTNVTENKDNSGKLPKYCQAGATCRLWGRVFPYASTFGPSSQVDFAFYLDQKYTHHVSEFYGLPPPAGFTALADR